MPPDAPFTLRPSARCPICRKPPRAPFLPFCSRACRDKDLIGWFDEDYRIPARGPGDEGDNPEDGDNS